MKKRVIIFLLVLLIAMSFILPALATESVSSAEQYAAVRARGDAVTSTVPSAKPEPEPEPEPKGFIYLDGVPQSVEYEVRNGTTYVTVSSFAVMVDPQAATEEANGVVTVGSARDGETLSMKVSTQVPYIVANGRYLYAKDSITTVDGSVAVPIRLLAPVYNLNVGYDGTEHAVLLTHIQGRSAYIQPGDSYYDEDDLYWLSRIIFAESGNQPLEGKIAVGNVVLNRVASPLFPNTLYGVLSQKNQFVSPSTLKKKTPNSESVVAAKLVLDGAEVLPTALFFARAGLSCYASRNRPYVTTIGAHAFYA